MKVTAPALCVSAVLVLHGSGTACAQAAAHELPPALLACADENDVMRRLSCYDREMAALKAQVAPPAVARPDTEPVAGERSASQPVEPAIAAPVAATPVPREQPSTPTTMQAPSSNPVASSSVAAPVPETPQSPPPQAPANQPDTAAAPAAQAPEEDFDRNENAPKEFTAVVTGIRKRPYGELIILLDNGQIWEQKHLDRRFRLEVGEQVTISKGLISGYRLSGRSNDSIQVERRQ